MDMHQTDTKLTYIKERESHACWCEFESSYLRDDRPIATWTTLLFSENKFSACCVCARAHTHTTLQQGIISAAQISWKKMVQNKMLQCPWDLRTCGCCLIWFPILHVYTCALFTCPVHMHTHTHTQLHAYCLKRAKLEQKEVIIVLTWQAQYFFRKNLDISDHQLLILI